MITGKIKNQVDAIWMSFWTGGITNSIDVLEQMTYLFFMKMVDDAQLSQEAKAAMMGMGDVELPDAPEVILSRIETLQSEIIAAMNEFKTKYMK
jgi:uncharacterized membrane protein